MLTEKQIVVNKETFINLINSIKREFDKEKLLNWLESSDFFRAPASTKYHLNCDGGLCQHSLNVYYSLEALCNTFATIPDKDNNYVCRYSKDSILICGLLHDISKANFYEKYNKNVKNETTGQWEKVASYKIRENENRFLYGNHEENSEFMVRSFIPLEVEESVAILHHMGETTRDSSQPDLSAIYTKYNLAALLHAADYLSTFCLENEITD